MRQLCRTALLALLAASCNSMGPAFNPAQELVVHRSQWRKANIHDYTFDYTVLGQAIGPSVRIIVLADTVRSASRLDTGAACPVAGLPTIEGLFSEIQDLLGSRNYQTTVQYNSTWGFPILINASSPLPDAAFTVRIANVDWVRTV